MDIDPNMIMSEFSQILNLMIQDAVRYIPNMIWAVILLIVGYILSKVVASVVSKLFGYLKVEDVLRKYKVEDALGGNEVTSFLVAATKLYVLLLFIKEAVIALNLPSVAGFITSAITFAPAFIGVGLLIVATAIIGEWVRESILSMHKFYMQKTIAEILKWGIVFVSVVVSLETVGFEMGFAKEVFNKLLEGLVYGFALAVGLAFGLGGQKDAQDIIKKTRKALKV